MVVCDLCGCQNKQPSSELNIRHPRRYVHAQYISLLFSNYSHNQHIYIYFFFDTLGYLFQLYRTITYLYSINCVACIAETDCVYCAVRAESLSIIQVNFSV
jgi:hypothetical protein